jgi:tripartite-type tricarboxylate transporter receptor subunit TctC
VILGATLADNVNTILTPNLAKCRANRDFEAIGLAATIPMMVVTAYDSPYKTIHDLIKYDKASPGSVTYGSAGNGGSAHLSAALLATQSGTRMTHIPFKGNAPALSEVMAGRVSFMFYPMVGVNALTAQKRIRPLSVSLAQRHPDFPNVPTMKESGFKDFEDYTPGVGLLAPLGTSPDILAKLNQALRTALANPETAKRLADLGAIPAPTTPAQYQTWLQKDYERWERVIRAAGVPAE